MSNQNSESRSGVAAVMRPVNTFVERYVPSALVFAIVLTFVVALLAWILTDSTGLAIATGWGEGLSGLLSFMTQMSLILMLGHTLANTGPVRRLLARLGEVPATALQAYLFVFVIAVVASLITWGLGLVVGALLAIEVAAQGREKGLKLHFPMLIAAGYSGYVIWHMGYSGSGTLAAAADGSFIAKQLGHTIPISDTIFAWWNIAAIIATIIVVAAALALVAPRGDDRIVELDHDARDDDRMHRTHAQGVTTPADRVDASRLLTTLLGLALVAYLVSVQKQPFPA